MLCRKRIIACICTVVMCFSIVAVPASATENSDIGWRIAETIFDSPFSSWAVDLIKEFLGSGTTPETATPQDWQDAYGKYVINIQNNYGTSAFTSDGGFIIPLTWEVNRSMYCTETMANSSSAASGTLLFSPSFNAYRVYMEYRAILPKINLPAGNMRYSVGPYGMSARHKPVELTSYMNVSFYPGLYYGGSELTTENQHFGAGGSFVSVLDGPYFTFGIDISSADSSSLDTLRSLIRNDIFSCFCSLYIIFTPDDGNVPAKDSRPGSLHGITYGYQNDTGEIIVYTDVDSGMFNEEGGYLYNPVTGETLQAASWYYDYENRRYDIALANNQGSASLEYGDDKATVTITNSGNTTTYNYFYMVPEGGGGEVTPSPSPSPEVCQHTYTSSVTTPASCLSTGLTTYTCSKCGNTYTEIIPATGHSYVVDRTVNTTYDKDGNILTQGYTIYKCTGCGNEYKDADSTGPPPSGGGDSGGNWFTNLLQKIGELLGSVIGGLLELIGTAIMSIIDSLITLVGTAVEKLSNLVNLFGSFGEALGVLWSWLPSEVVTVLVAGVTVVIFAAVLKIFL